MSEEFKKPQPLGKFNLNFLSAPTPEQAGPLRKDRNSRSQLEFLRLMENNKDPLNLQGRPLQNYTLDQVSQHNTETDAWIILNGKVYDMTIYINYHPGGKIILNAAGQDGTHLFNRYHPWVNIEPIMSKLQIGTLITSHL
jgi:cytochrome-b5 reductase